MPSPHPQPPENLSVGSSCPDDDTVQVSDEVVDFVLALERIFQRLMAEGYRWENEKLLPPRK